MREMDAVDEHTQIGKTKTAQEADRDIPSRGLSDSKEERMLQMSDVKKELDPVLRQDPLIDEMPKTESSNGNVAEICNIVQRFSPLTDIKQEPGVHVKEEFVSSELPGSGINELKDTPKKFQKNSSYHGTGKLLCPSLGDGWSFEQIVRQQGKSAGRYDTYYYSPSGVRIRSKLKLSEYIDIDLTNFDYNSGKFIQPGNSGSVVSPKTKMSLLKKNELKTIDRSVESLNEASPISNVKKESRKLTVKFPPHKKLFAGTGEKKKPPKKAKKRKQTSIANGNNAADANDDDSVQNNPFEAFKREALGLSSYFDDMKDYEDLIQFAWNFLSIESKTRFSDASNAENSPPSSINASNAINCPADCVCPLCDGQLRPKKLKENNILFSSINSLAETPDTAKGIAASQTYPSNSPLHEGQPDRHADLGVTLGSQCSSTDRRDSQESNSIESTASNNGIHSPVKLVKNSMRQKPHKRKSRTPVCIKQQFNGEDS